MHFPNSTRDEFLEALEAYASPFQKGSKAALRRACRSVRGCSDTLPGAYSDLAGGLVLRTSGADDLCIGTYDEAAQQLLRIL